MWLCLLRVVLYFNTCFCFWGPIKPLYETINPIKRTDVLVIPSRTRNKWHPVSIGVFLPWCRSHSRCATLDWCGAAIAGAEPFAVTDGHGIVITYPCWLNYLCVYLRPSYQTDAVPSFERRRRNQWTIGYCDNLLIVSYGVYMIFNLAQINHSRQKNRRLIDFTLLYCFLYICKCCGMYVWCVFVVWVSCASCVFGVHDIIWFLWRMFGECFVLIGVGTLKWKPHGFLWLSWDCY